MPRNSAAWIFFSSVVRTKNVPRIELMMPTPASTTGNRTSVFCRAGKSPAATPHSCSTSAAESAHASATDEMMLPT